VKNRGGGENEGEYNDYLTEPVHPTGLRKTPHLYQKVASPVLRQGKTEGIKLIPNPRGPGSSALLWGSTLPQSGKTKKPNHRAPIGGHVYQLVSEGGEGGL